jgi:hypothetical protein
LLARGALPSVFADEQHARAETFHLSQHGGIRSTAGVHTALPMVGRSGMVEA